MINLWTETTLGEVIELYDHERIPLSTQQRSQRQGGYPYYGASGIIDYIDDYIFDGRFLLISEDGANLVERKTPIAFFASGKFWVNNHAHVVRGIPGVADDYFLMSYIQSANISGYITGTAQPKLSQSNLKAIKLPLPPFPIQRKIAAALSTYDDLIENNTRRIEILEEMAAAIYREWFVEFRFPGHEGVEMVESELGLIPQGWEVVAASEAISINPKTSVPRETRKPFVPMKSATEHSMLITEVEERIGTSGKKFKNHDTLFARITPCLENGRTGFVQFLPSDDMVALGSTEFTILRSKTLNPYFVYLLAQTHDFRDNAIKGMTGATGRQRVVDQCFDNYFLPNPNQDKLRQFECIIAPLFKKVQNLGEKNQILRQTRDLLLPKLISGEIDVSELDIDTNGKK